MPVWAFWLIAAALLGIAELFTLTIDLGLLAVAAAAAGLTGLLLPVGPFVQLIAFAIAALLTLGVVRPIVRRHARRPPLLRTGVAALVGREAVALTEVTKEGGRIQLAGEEWTARPYDSSIVIPEGATVDVLEIEGATALVYPTDQHLKELT